MAEYDTFAGIYDLWTSGAPVTAHNLPFYVDEYVSTPGLVVELGVGNGRIAVEAARRGKAITGVDVSGEMLKLCRARAEAAGVAPLVTLIQADMRDFDLPEPAQLITIPFHSIGHLATLDDKRAALRHIHDRLGPGGRLIFDHFIFDPDKAARYTVPTLRDEAPDRLLWTTNRYDWDAQIIRIIAWTDDLAPDGTLLRRQYRRLTFSWITPEQIRALLAEAGLEVVALYGFFDRRPFDGTASEQVWIARRAG